LDSFQELQQQTFLIFASRLDFGYASKPKKSASVACSTFQGFTFSIFKFIFQINNYTRNLA
jgi:hypothetical protein